MEKMCVGSTQPPDKFYLDHTSAVTLLVKINKPYLVGCLMLSLEDEEPAKWVEEEEETHRL